MSEPLTTRCTICGAEFTDTELVGVQACPKCGSKSLPMSIADDILLRINWHELRILGMWADNWAGTPNFPEHSRKTVTAILTRIETQFPDKTPLTLAGEVRKLQDEFPSASLHKDGEVVVPPKAVQ